MLQLLDGLDEAGRHRRRDGLLALFNFGFGDRPARRVGEEQFDLIGVVADDQTAERLARFRDDVRRPEMSSATCLPGSNIDSTRCATVKRRLASARLGPPPPF